AFQKGGLLPAYIGSGTPMHMDLTIKTGALNIFPQPSLSLDFANGLVENIINPGVFASDIYISLCTAQSIGTDQQSFDQQMGNELHQVAILECPRLGLVGVADPVAGYALRLSQKAPFHSRREAGSAPAPKSALLHVLHILVGSHLQGLLVCP